MEFVQFHPTGMVWPPGGARHPGHRGRPRRRRHAQELRGRAVHVQLHPASSSRRRRPTTRRRPTAGTTDKKNDRRPPELLPRDEVARAINAEVKAGRGIPHGGVFLDIATRRSAEYIKKRLPSMYHQFKELADVDITKEPMEVGPDLPLHHGRRPGRRRHRQTTRAGACSPRAKCAGGMHGANRLGGNSLSDLLVFGQRAGDARRGVRRRPRRRQASIDEADPRRPSGAEPLAAARARRADENPYAIQAELQETMQTWSASSAPRTSSRRRSSELEALKERAAARCEVEGRPRYNPGWHLRSTCATCCSSRECITRAALEREESRGGHTRDDYPGTDDEVGQAQHRRSRQRRRRRRRPRRPSRCRRCRTSSSRVLRGETATDMAYTLKMRRLARRPAGGELQDYDVEVDERHGRARRHPPHPGHPGRRPRRAAGTARPASAARAAPRSTASRELMCMTRLSDFDADETDHGRPDADLPDHQRPRHRRLLELREGQARSRRSTPPPRDADGKRRMQQEDVERVAGVPQVHRVLPVPGRLPRPARPRGATRRRSPARASSSALAGLEMHPLDTVDRRELTAEQAGLGLLQHHQVLHRGLPRAHPHHRQRDHPAEGAGGGPQLRPAGVARHKIGIRDKDRDTRTEV